MLFRLLAVAGVCASLVYLAVVPSAQAGLDDGVQAAAVYNWGRPTGGDEFNGFSVDRAKWGIYDGPGHDGNGCRCPGQVTEGGGLLTITGLADGTSGGLAWRQGQTYGRWEARMRVVQQGTGGQPYHPVLILWPDSDIWPSGGEIDFAESDAGARDVGAFLHYADGSTDGAQQGFNTSVNLSQWHNYAVEWTADHISGYLDGKLWFRTADSFVQPPGPMHATVQLDDFFGTGTLNPAQLQLDWIRMYPVSATPPSH